MQFRYYCPTWFAEIDAKIRFNCLPVHFCIQTPRVVQNLDWLAWATLDEVKQKLSSRELTVNDVEPNRYSALHVSPSAFGYSIRVYGHLIADGDVQTGIRPIGGGAVDRGPVDRALGPDRVGVRRSVSLS